MLILSCPNVFVGFCQNLRLNESFRSQVNKLIFTFQSFVDVPSNNWVLQFNDHKHFYLDVHQIACESS